MGFKSVDALKVWRQQYKVPNETEGKARKELVHMYRPPRSDVQGVFTASCIIVAWAVTFYTAVFKIRLHGPDRTHPLPTLSVWLLLEYLDTGLFITAHDAMHGTVAFHSRKLNDFFGSVALSLYAWFDYKVLHEKHWEHHHNTGESGKDPDFHTGSFGFIPWFFHFMMQYLTAQQFMKLTASGVSLILLGAPLENLVVFYAGAGLASALRLFYFGTYLPHLPSSAEEKMNWEKSHSADCNALISVFKCYHFDYHWEHHRWPYAPWWELHKCKQLVKGH